MSHTVRADECCYKSLNLQNMHATTYSNPSKYAPKICKTYNEKLHFAILFTFQNQFLKRFLIMKFNSRDVTADDYIFGRFREYWSDSNDNVLRAIFRHYYSSTDNPSPTKLYRSLSLSLSSFSTSMNIYYYTSRIQ